MGRDASGVSNQHRAASLNVTVRVGWMRRHPAYTFMKG
nr:MAG TPA: hypothetical protein [Caudoviricetes sp.]